MQFGREFDADRALKAPRGGDHDGPALARAIIDEAVARRIDAGPRDGFVQCHTIAGLVAEAEQRPVPRDAECR